MQITSSNSTENGATETKLVTVQEVAAQLAISVRSVWRLVSAGKFIQPIKLGGATRWRQADVTDWVAAGCPISR